MFFFFSRQLLCSPENFQSSNIEMNRTFSLLFYLSVESVGSRSSSVGLVYTCVRACGRSIERLACLFLVQIRLLHTQECILYCFCCMLCNVSERKVSCELDNIQTFKKSNKCLNTS